MKDVSPLFTSIERAQARRNKAEFDARWWHKRTTRSADAVTVDRLRELYPSMFDLAGHLLPSEAIDFRHVVRVKAPAEQSAAYRRHGVARHPRSRTAA